MCFVMSLLSRLHYRPRRTSNEFGWKRFLSRDRAIELRVALRAVTDHLAVFKNQPSVSSLAVYSAARKEFFDFENRCRDEAQAFFVSQVKALVRQKDLLAIWRLRTQFLAEPCFSPALRILHDYFASIYFNPRAPIIFKVLIL